MSFYPDLIASSITVAGKPVHTYEAGERRDGESTIVMVHGTGGTLEGHFAALFSMLAGRNHVVGLDLATTKGEILQLEDLVEQVVAVVRSVTTPVVLVGYSLGAVVAAAVAGRHPDLIERLVLVAGWIQSDNQQRLRNDVWRALYEEESPAFAGFSSLLFFGSSYLAGLRQEQIDEIVDGVVAGPGIDEQMELNRRIDISEDVAAITAPTLVIGGTYDQMVPVRHSKQLFGAITDARFAELPAGHAVVFERPAELFALIDEFTTTAKPQPAGTVRVPAVI